MKLEGVSQPLKGPLESVNYLTAKEKEPLEATALILPPT
jgi:hypothetical protein